ncbi:MAG TPA: hypothetical protein G4O16_03020 [Dehalococcoidia bacterium]|nr:hypothetical protein [Dehalococcoidia bacterium]
MMQIRKTYTDINPELLYAEIRDFALKQGLTLGENKQETYTIPDESAMFISRGNLSFSSRDGECLRVHIVGSKRGETKLMIDTDDKLFPGEKLQALQEDLDFVVSSYEAEE